MPRKLNPDPELDALVRGLNDKARESVPPIERPAGAPPATVDENVSDSRWTLPAPSEEGLEYLHDLLRRAREKGASDLLIVAGRPPAVRLAGRLERFGEHPLTDGLTGLICGALVPVAARRTADRNGATDFACSFEGLGRVRCNVHRQRDSWAVAVRFLAEARPSLGSLNLPSELAFYAELEHGLVLVTGPTGSGKTSTLAALCRHVLEHRPVHLITIEDPVEYEQQHGSSVVEHVEVGRDVNGFSVALRAALRQDPDVLLVGEMRDRESVSLAITAGETGHLVLASLHTRDAPGSIHRIVDSYPAEQQDQVRAQLSISLAGVVSQQLVPRVAGAGRVPAIENLVATPAVRNLIRLGKIEQLRSQLMLEQRAGMISMDESLARLCKAGVIAEDDARFRARDATEFAQRLRA